MEELLQQPVEQAVWTILEYQMHGEFWRVMDPYSQRCEEGKNNSAGINGALMAALFMDLQRR